MDELKSLILDIIFPRRCLSCNILISEPGFSYICSICLPTISFKNEFACAFCKSPVIGGKTCPFCRPTHFLDRLLVVTSYDDPLVEKILKTMKYRFIRSLADDIANLTNKYLGKNKLLDKMRLIVVPVPLHRLRLNWRGFNQSEIIAKSVADHFGFEMQTETLCRIRHSIPQAEIHDRKSRIENIKNSFACKNPESIKEKNILLVDDVSTTGSTLDACAEILKSAGAKEVIGLVFARN